MVKVMHEDQMVAVQDSRLLGLDATGRASRSANSLYAGFLTALASTVFLAGCGGHAAGGPGTDVGPLAHLAAACAASVNPQTGVGVATISAPMVSAHETVTFTTPCHLHIASGGSLQLVEDGITAKTLYIGDDDSYAGTTVDIESSTIQSSGDFGLAVQLYDARDQFRMNSTKVSFQEAFMVRIDGQGPSGQGGGNIAVDASSVGTPGPGSRGIEFVAGDASGIAAFANDTFATGDFGAPAFMFAGSCHFVQVDGADGNCGALPARPLPQETPPPIP